MALEQDASSAQKISMLVVEKEATMLSTLHRLANCVKNGTAKKIVSPKRCQRLACCSVVHNYFRSSFRILLTVFLEIKTQLWKLI